MSTDPVQQKPWGGRFDLPTDPFVEAFTASVNFDQRLWQQDIRGSKAHVEMLAFVGVLSAEECASISAGLTRVAREIERGTFSWSTALEDVHMNIEARLVEHIGDVGKKLHTARSRNDQVATDLRLYLREAIDTTCAQLHRLQDALLNLALREAATIMPGFTHLQAAQPVTFGHHLMAWFEALLRDSARFADCRKRVNILPLGAAALAGTPYPIDRAYTAQLLGFDGVCENSLDAVSDRDFAIEFCAASAMLMMHLSRIAEELVLWSSPQFGFIELSEAFCTGSSIMPQKKNPDVPELVRGKTGRIYGHLMALLTLMKAQPLAYNKDNQEDKEPLFDTVDTVLGCLRAFADLVPEIEVKREALLGAAKCGFTTATDLADYLVGKGVPFRDAHAVVGQAVRRAMDEGCDLDELSIATLREFCDAIDADVFAVLQLSGSVAARNHVGGTAPDQVRAAIARGRERMAEFHSGTDAS